MVENYNPNQAPRTQGESGMAWRLRVIEQARTKVGQRFGNGLIGRERWSSFLGSFSRLKGQIQETKILGKSIPEIGAGMAAGSFLRILTRESLIAAGFASLPLAITTGALVGGAMALGREYLKNAAEMPKRVPRAQTKQEYLQQQKSRGEKIDFLHLNSLESRSPAALQEEEITNLDYYWGIIKKTRPREIARGAAFGAGGAVIGSLATEAIMNIPGWTSSISKTIGEQFTSYTKPPVLAPEANPEQMVNSMPPPASQPETPLPPNTSPEEPKIVFGTGTNLWDQTREFLEQQLNRKPTNTEIAQGVRKLIIENHLSNGNMVKAGAILNATSLTHIADPLDHIPAPAPLLQESVQTETVRLEKGGSVWSSVTKALRNSLHREPLNFEILEKAKEVCRNSGVSVPSWGITRGILHTKLPVGYQLSLN